MPDVDPVIEEAKKREHKHHCDVCGEDWKCWGEPFADGRPCSSMKEMCCDGCAA